MNFIKIAGSGKFAIVEIRINKDGGVKRIVKSHEGTDCKGVSDEDYLNDLMATMVRGHHGEFAPVTKDGHTKEYFESLQKDRGHLTAPMAIPEEEEDAVVQLPEETRELDKNYGVGT